MNKTANIWLVVAAAFVAAGLVLSGISIAAANGDFGIFSNGKLKTSTYEITEEFENISLAGVNAEFIDSVQTTEIYDYQLYMRNERGNSARSRRFA